MAPRKLADTLRLEGRLAEAEAVLRSLVDRFPRDTHSWHTLGRVYIDAGDRAHLEQVVAHLQACPQGEIFAALLESVWCLRWGPKEQAGAHIDRAIALAPQMPLARVLRAEWLIAIGAPRDACIQALKDVLRVQPGHQEARQLLARWLAPTEPVGRDLAGWFTTVVAGEGLPGHPPAA